MRICIALIVFCLALVPAFAKEKMTVDEVVAAHLKTLGASGQGENQRHELAGKAHLEVRGAASIDGEGSLLAQQRKMKFTADFASPDYPGEQIAFNGDDVQIAYMKPGVYSALGDFLYLQPVLVKEGLFGGSLVSGWALKDYKGRKAKLSYDGLKKVEGRELHQLTYRPRGAERLTVKLYFAPETFQHVLSRYVMTIRPTAGEGSRNLNIPMSKGPTSEGMNTTETRFTLEERFEDYRETNGVSVPSKWTIDYQGEAGMLPSVFAMRGGDASDRSGSATSGAGRRWTWTMNFDKFNVTPVAQ